MDKRTKGKTEDLYGSRHHQGCFDELQDYPKISYTTCPLIDMGRLINGEWTTEDLGPDARGRYARRKTEFRNNFDEPKFPAKDVFKQRYVLIAGSPCGWSHRVLLVRALMKIDEYIPVIFSDAFMGQEGWTFYKHGDSGGIEAEELYLDPASAGYSNSSQIVAQKLYEVYSLAQNDYSGRCSVPVLWDRQNGMIVNNESSDLIMMLKDVQMKEPLTINLVPVAMKASINEMIDANYMPINNGVYRCGFAGNQEAYTEAAIALFKRLDELEEILERQRYLCSSNQVTMADLCLFPTLYRFDMVYYTHFKCNKKHIYEYPNLWGWLLEIYQLDGVAKTCRMKECCIHYYTSHESIHPRRYIPLGPDLDFDAPHGRDKVEYGNH